MLLIDVFNIIARRQTLILFIRLILNLQQLYRIFKSTLFSISDYPITDFFPMNQRVVYIVIRCLIVVLLLSAAVGGRYRLQAAAVEGVVDLAEATKRPRLTKRYGKSGNSPQLPPEPPVAVIYLEGSFKKKALIPPEVAPELLQQGLQFSPRILPVIVGTSINFPNRDDTYHNVFSYSPAKSFDLGRYRKGENVPSILFDKPGLVKVFCEVHNHMRAFILVLESPYYTRSDKNGVYRLTGLPEGNFTLKALISEKTVHAREIVLIKGETVKVDFSRE